MKTVMITIQIDKIKAADLADIEEKIEAALQEYRRKRINYNLQDTFGIPIISAEE